jgi:alpha/beta hydrolase fold
MPGTALRSLRLRERVRRSPARPPRATVSRSPRSTPVAVGRTPDWPHSRLLLPSLRISERKGDHHGERCDRNDFGEHADRALPRSRAAALAALWAQATGAIPRPGRTGRASSRPRGGVGRARPLRPRHGRAGRVALVDQRAARASRDRSRSARLGSDSAIDFSRQEYKTLVADVLRGALDALDVQRAHVVGGSIGNVWALRLAEQHASRVERIVLMGGGPIVEESGVPGIIRLLASPAGAVMVRLPDSPTGCGRSSGRQATVQASTPAAFR